MVRSVKKTLVAVSLCATLGLAACHDAPRSQLAQLENVADVAAKVQANNFPYVLGGGSMRGATTGADGVEPGFDSAGLISFAFADGCRAKIGDSVQEIYKNTKPLEVEEGEPLEVVEGELVFDKDKTVAAIIVQPGSKGALDGSEVVYADKESGEVVREEFDPDKFERKVRTLDRIDIRKLIKDYGVWKDSQDSDKSPKNSGEFVDPEDGQYAPSEIDSKTRR